MHENAIITVILCATMLLELTGGVVLYRRWNDVRESRHGLRLPLCAVSILSALIPPLVLWCISFVGFLLNVKPTWRLVRSISGATENVLYVYALAIAGSSRFLWGSLLVVVFLGWVTSILARERNLFLTSHVLTVATVSLPPILLLLGAIPYVGE